MKRILTLILTLLLAISLSVPAMAATSQEVQDAAQLLYNLNLFRGTGTNPDGSVNFELERAPNRIEAVIMLIRLLGQEDKALSESHSIPFTDVPNWAKPYIGYAYANGLTHGTEDTLFGSNSNVTAPQYLIFLLRALGYKDNVDFSPYEPWVLTDKIGVTYNDYNNQSNFLRGDAAVLSTNSLYATLKGSDQTLLQHLLASGAINDSTVVIWDYNAVAFKDDFCSFLFYPVKGSPATFTHFKLDKITINGLGCQTLQVNTPEAVAAYLASIGYDAGGFGYVEISYDQEAALNAATKFHTDENGNVYPLLEFCFSYTGTQKDGTKVTGSFTDYYYLDAKHTA